LPLVAIDKMRATLKQVNGSVVDSFSMPENNAHRHAKSYVLMRQVSNWHTLYIRMLHIGI
jgi:hypothetical protein